MWVCGRVVGDVPGVGGRVVVPCSHVPSLPSLLNQLLWLPFCRIFLSGLTNEWCNGWPGFVMAFRKHLFIYAYVCLFVLSLMCFIDVQTSPECCVSLEYCVVTLRASFCWNRQGRIWGNIWKRNIGFHLIYAVWVKHNRKMFVAKFDVKDHWTSMKPLPWEADESVACYERQTFLFSQ